VATTRIWKIVKRLDHVVDYAVDENKTKNIEFKNDNRNFQMIVNDLRDVIDYAMNPDKTEKQFYVTGINCESFSAYEEMKNTKEFFHKEDGILGFHAYQSFKEKVSPEVAHQIGIELAKEIWGDRFQVIVTTHLNTEHTHNHFVVNSVSFVDGLKYYDNHTTYSRIRHFSDELCKEYGLDVIKEKPTKANLKYDNFYKKSLYNDSYSKNAKKEIDLAIRQAYSYDDFIYLMKKLDYEIIIRAGKMSVRKNNYNRNIRIERRFGEDYTIDNIKRRIIEEQAIRVPFIENVYTRKINYPFAKRHKKAKAKGFIALYYHYCYLLKVFPNNVPQQKLPASIRADVLRMEELSNQAKLLATNNIKTLDDLLNYKDELNYKINELSNNRERLWAIRKLSKDDDERKNITEQISTLTINIDKLRKEVDQCEDIKSRVQKIDENLTELDTQEELEKETKEKKSKEKNKKGKE
jgi:hypothetical protein